MNTGLPLWLDLLVSALVVAGTAFALVGSWGLARLGSFLTRLHGPTKTVTMGIGCVLIASMAAFAWGPDGQFSGHELLITLFLFLTAPVSAHLLIQAALKLDPASRPPPPPSPSSPSNQAE
jgi:multicomponent K+:H+ antiporter subunit G